MECSSMEVSRNYQAEEKDKSEDDRDVMEALVTSEAEATSIENSTDFILCLFTTNKNYLVHFWENWAGLETGYSAT